MLRGTPFHRRTSALCHSQSWRRWAGYLAANSYELTHDREYFAIRTAAALIDVSPLFKYLVRGPDAEPFLDRLVTRNVRQCAVGQVMYTPWCTAAGKVIDDGTLARLDEQTFRLTAAEPNLWWLRENASGFDVEISDLSDAVAAMALQGPASRDILAHVTATSLDGLRYYRTVSTHIAEIPATISRTGYTGDLGYEIWVDADAAEPLWDALIEAGTPFGVAPAGMLALDAARIEAGLLLIGVDYISAHAALVERQKSSPFELGLGWTVKLDKEAFVGRDALQREHREGSDWCFRGVEVDWDSLERAYAEVGLPPQLPAAPWRASVPVYAHDKQVGYATSGCWSPILKKYIALAHIKSTHAEPGTGVSMEVTVDHQRRTAAARVVPSCFFNPPRKRACP